MSASCVACNGSLGPLEKSSWTHCLSCLIGIMHGDCAFRSYPGSVKAVPLAKALKKAMKIGKLPKWPKEGQ